MYFSALDQTIVLVLILPANDPYISSIIELTPAIPEPGTAKPHLVVIFLCECLGVGGGGVYVLV